MHIDKEHAEECWISFILRVAMASLFGMAGASKFMMGLGNASAYIQSAFQKTWLPSWLVTPYATILPFAEVIIALWLLSGIKLREGWVFTAFVLISLAFGLMVTQQPTASSVYMDVLMACAGLYFSRYDRCAWGCKK